MRRKNMSNTKDAYTIGNTIITLIIARAAGDRGCFRAQGKDMQEQATRATVRIVLRVHPQFPDVMIVTMVDHNG